MKSIEKILYLGGVARSGSSWVGQILASHPKICFRFQPLFAYKFKGRVNEDSSKEDFEKLFIDMAMSSDDFLCQEDKKLSGEYPGFTENGKETVLAFKENRYQSVIGPMLRRVPGMQLIGLIRHPCAVLNSWRKNPKEFPLGSDFRKEWRHGMCKNSGPEDYFGYLKWKEVSHLYLDLAEQHPERVLVQRYEDLVNNPLASSEHMFQFCGLDYAPEVAAFVQESTSSHQESYYSVYKNPYVAVKWRQEMPQDIVDEIYEDLRGTRLEQFLYEPF
ncbi:sulfotransferase family protein [Vreelandella utahensis]|uniref:sulfotransferase family protein n=1 Tax=Vreelandella halophila TaxID=86177 RepID=UPI00098659C1|nr:sulfotransferase [Halomonas utahensis]